jgi:hypothetical protein
VTRQLISFDEIKHGMVEISEKVGPFMMVVWTSIIVYAETDVVLNQWKWLILYSWCSLIRVDVGRGLGSFTKNCTVHLPQWYQHAGRYKRCNASLWANISNPGWSIINFQYVYPFASVMPPFMKVVPHGQTYQIQADRLLISDVKLQSLQ